MLYAALLNTFNAAELTGGNGGNGFPPFFRRAAARDITLFLPVVLAMMSTSF